MKIIILLSSLLIGGSNFMYAQTKILPFIGFENNKAHNTFGEILKKNTPRLETKLGTGRGPITGIFIKNSSFPIIPFVKTGFLFHKTRVQDTIIAGVQYMHKSQYKLIPMYFGIMKGFGSNNFRFGFKFEFGCDYALGKHDFWGLESVNTKELALGWSAQINLILHPKNNIGFIPFAFGIAQKHQTRFFHISIKFPISIKSSKT